MYAMSGAARAPEEDRRFALKHATDEAHQRVEAIVQGAGMFASRDGYRHYLAASWEIRARFEAGLDASGAADVWPDWPRRRIAHLIAADMVDLGDEAPPPQKYVQGTLSTAELLGVLYVLEGSSLGARVLVRMTDGLGLTATFGARHLHAQAGDRNAWRSFLACMDAAVEPPSVASALSTFAAFGDAYARQAAR